MVNKGYCPIHKAITAAAVLAEKEKHPDAKVLAHPECVGEVLALADAVGSTAQIIQYVKKSDAPSFIVCTEVGISCELRRDNPDKRFYFVEPCPCCLDMKLNTPERILEVLKTGKNAVTVDEAVRQRALLPLDRMLELAK
jgi:quinolinate synthase